MLRSGIPTARASWHVNPTEAKEAARRFGAPVVVKASGLAAGKGVVICRSTEEADQAIDAMLLGHLHGAAGAEILVEEFMDGEELSVFAITDGESFMTMLPAQDHKRLLAGDDGPNTGGMGAYAPVSIATSEIMLAVSGGIISKTLLALKEHGCPFRGLLYCGLMLTGAGPKVVEFNCRFGDPETQVVVPLLRSSLLDLMLRAGVTGGLGSAPPIEHYESSAVTTVVAAPGYPESPKTGARVELPPSEPDVLVFHAGTRRAPDGTLLTAGGRVVAVTATADSIEEAQRKSLRTAELVHFPGRYFRTDIGWRELRRRAGAA
jgi:phosphoribosylamine--glycine ligase